MSDTSKLASDNLEPSMEDILSSIRKVITDDMAMEEAGQENSPEAGAKTGAETAEGAEQLVGNTSDDLLTDSLSDDLADDLVIDQSSQIDQHSQQGTDIFENILDLEMLVDEPSDSSQNPQPETPDSADDNMLDFIGLEGDEIGDLQDIELEAIDLDFDAPISSNLDLENNQFDEMQTVAPEVELDTSLDLVVETDSFEDIAPLLPETEVGAEAETAVDSPTLEAETSLPDASLPDNSQFESPDDTEQTIPEPATPDEDIDLVKSLLADLMDEPAGPENEVESENEVETEAATRTEIEGGAPILDNADMFTTDLEAIAEEQFLAEELIIPDPAQNLAVDVRPSDFENDEQDDIPPQNASHKEITPDQETAPNEETPLEAESFDHGAQTDNTLADIAEAASLASENGYSKTPVQPGPDLTVDDVVDISDAELLSKLTLIATATASSATALSDETPKPDCVESIQKESPQDERLEPVDTQSQITTPAPIPAPISAPIPTPIPATAPIKEPKQEDNIMVTPLQKETLIDEQTEQVTTTAFATLTTAVAEKSLAEENGPHIGELVKEALKPMLQEWLDKNLKTMVQRAVTKEIKRISSGK